MSKMIIDVREPEEYQTRHSTGAFNIPLLELDNAAELMTLDKDTDIVVYCRTGDRSEVAKQLLNAKGFNKVTNGVNAETVACDYGIGLE
ncbi:MAG: rhodanese-like domain-containing protein [Candidatus Saccharibacteria bacterium]|nr:rhodanese-like domain-containing protein [Candidatus Saccharibacteria bacterium]